MVEGTEAVKRTQEFMKKIPDLTITDVPTKTRKLFIKFANEEFRPRNGTAHYGFALKHLVDFYFGFLGDVEAKTNEALLQVSELKRELEELKSDKQVEQVVKNVAGDVIRTGGTK